jgi:nicotinate-nucleotide adenylyltransferase
VRIAVFGGSFDPVHYGHLLLAETCRETCRLDLVLLVPNAIPPHKPHRPLTPVRQRLQMLRLAVADCTRLEVSSLEADRGGVSYTVETLVAVRGQFPDATIYFLMGADALRDLPTWREPARICQLAHPLIVARHGAPEPDLTILHQLRGNSQASESEPAVLPMPRIDISSTELRDRVREGRSIRFRTPRSVEEYIHEHQLYRSEELDRTPTEQSR